MPGWLNLPPPAKKQNIPKALRDIRSFRKHRYRCFDGSYTRYVAEQYCERLGGHLVSIDDADEQVFVQRLLLSQPKPAEWYWIDGSDEGVEDVWRKGDGGKFDFANWANGQPQNIWLGEHGLVMHTRDMCRWHDAHSGMRLGFVCEWE